ncbi:MAG: SDR family NAD(P)-dependent oxidoreductase [Actinomycetia bacterium]|nr:SDR family NAD(P)-dependent oxidoreductase [Actinomycetes bacterium]
MRVALVTAGARGLGRAVAEVLRDHGYTVAVTTRRADEGVRAWARADARHPEALVVPWDPLAPDAGPDPVEVVLDRLGRLDVLVNNAGPYVRDPVGVGETSDAMFDAMFLGNVTAPFRLIRRALPAMRAARYGRIVNVGFVGAGQAAGWAQHGAYAAAKAALASLTRTVALEEARWGITCNMVCPSDIKGAAKEAPQGEGPEPTGGDVAHVVRFLLDERSRFLTGQVVEVSFGPGWGPVPGSTTHPLAETVLPVGTPVWVPAWGERAVIRRTRQEAGEVWYWLEADQRQGELPARSVRRAPDPGP